MKQSYSVEDMRSLAFIRLKNLAALVLAVAYFVMVWMGHSERREVLRTHIVTVAKRFFKAPEFYYYEKADGIHRLLTRCGKWSATIDPKTVADVASPQLEFDFSVDTG